MRKKYKPLSKIPCAYCSVFQNSKRVLDSGHIRWCKFLNKDISSEDLGASSCPDFTPSSHFWCDKYQQRIAVNICLHRKERKSASCSRCKIHATIIEVKKRENGQIESSWRKLCREVYESNLGETKEK